MRIKIKHEVLLEQMELVPNMGYIPVCPLCWEKGRYSLPTDAHECIIKRSDVQTWSKAKRKLIFAMPNTVVLCRGCHMLFGQTEWMTVWSWDYKTAKGYDLDAWIASLPFKHDPAHRRR